MNKTYEKKLLNRLQYISDIEKSNFSTIIMIQEGKNLNTFGWFANTIKIKC